MRLTLGELETEHLRRSAEERDGERFGRVQLEAVLVQRREAECPDWRRHRGGPKPLCVFFFSVSALRFGMNSSEWEYAAEGGANLVVRYRGPASSPFVGKILRLRKRKLDLSPIGVSPALELPSTLLTTLLGQDLLVKSDKIILSTEFLDELNADLARTDVRPTDRATVDEIDPTCESGVLMPDLTHGNQILAIEIKVSLPLFSSINRPDRVV